MSCFSLFAALVPEKADAPNAVSHTGDTITLSWTLPTSFGVPLTGCKLFRKKIRRSNHPDELSDCEDDDLDLVRGAAGGNIELAPDPLIVAHEHSPSKPHAVEQWGKPVVLPPSVGYVSDVSGASAGVTKSLKKSGRTPTGKVLTWTTIQTEGEPLRVQIVIGGLYAGSVHRFRLQFSNCVGWGTLSDASVPVTVCPLAPLAPARPIAHVTGPHDVILQWTQPHSNGAFIHSYRIEVAVIGRGRLRQAASLLPLPTVHGSDSSGDDENTITTASVSTTTRSDCPFTETDAFDGADPSVLHELISLSHVSRSADWILAAEQVDPLVARDTYRGFTDVNLSTSLQSSPSWRSSQESTTVSVAARHDGYGSVLAWSLPTLRPGTQYMFRVFALNRVGSSPPSEASAVCRTQGAKRLIILSVLLRLH